MSEVAARELRNDTAGFLRRAASGEDIVITVRGKPVAHLVPVRELGAHRAGVRQAGVLGGPARQVRGVGHHHRRAHLLEVGRRLTVNDVWIASTAIAHGLTLVTQDDDFDALDGVRGLTVVRV